jgi:hypothetical protein
MSTRPSEEELLDDLDAHDALVMRCAHGELSWEQFQHAYDKFYPRYPLDGHESGCGKGTSTAPAQSSRLDEPTVLCEPSERRQVEIVGFAPTGVVTAGPVNRPGISGGWFS